MKLEALAALTGRDCFIDHALHLEARKGLQVVLEKMHAEGEPTTGEEDVLDELVVLGEAYEWMGMDRKGTECFMRAIKGFVSLLGGDSAKYVDAAYRVCNQTLHNDKGKIPELRRLWEIAKVSLPDEAVSYDIASQLGSKFADKRQFEEAKGLYFAALGGKRRVLGEEHDKALASRSLR